MASRRGRNQDVPELSDVRAAEAKARGFDRLWTAEDQAASEALRESHARRAAWAESRGVSSADPAPEGARRGVSGGARSGAVSPPLVTRGEHPGEAPAAEHPAYVDLVLDGGVLKQVMRRTGPDGRTAFVDWLHVTVHEDTAHRCGWPGSSLTDQDIVNAMSYAMTEVFGFGVTGQYDKGRNFYKRSYMLGEDGYGALMHGGQRNTVMIQLTGTGLAAARPGWERRLVDWLNSVAVQPRITRVDVAHDFFAGEYTPEQADSDYDAGLFRLDRSPKNPEIEHRGNWKTQTKKGRTLYIGVRTSGKFCRVYEKGRQLGDKESKWVRVEVEFKGVDRIIPFDVLLNPGAYLSGAYPAFAFIDEAQDRIRTVRESKACEKVRKEEWITHVAGRDLWVLHELEEGDSPEERALNLIQRLKDESRLPKWANLPDYRFSPAGIHESASCVRAATIDAIDMALENERF